MVSTEEAHIILNVPIPAVPKNDEFKWPFERGGKVTTQSAYHFIQAQRASGAGEEVSADDPLHKLWTTIWQFGRLNCNQKSRFLAGNL